MPRRNRRNHTNAPLPPPADAGGAPVRRHHYIVEYLDDANDVDTLAAALNDRAGQGYRMKHAHFYNITGGVAATVIYERRLRKPKATARPAAAAAGPAAATAPDLDRTCTECEYGLVQSDAINHVRATGLCPNCDTPWPQKSRAQPQSAGSEA